MNILKQTEANKQINELWKNMKQANIQANKIQFHFEIETVFYWTQRNLLSSGCARHNDDNLQSRTKSDSVSMIAL